MKTGKVLTLIAAAVALASSCRTDQYGPTGHVPEQQKPEQETVHPAGYILEQTQKMEECMGLFCWEPQTDGIWKPANYTALGWGAYDKGAFKDGKPTAALDPFKE